MPCASESHLKTVYNVVSLFLIELTHKLLLKFICTTENILASITEACIST